MRILLTGATGFIGRALTLRLRRDGHQLAAWVRSAERARKVLGADVELIESDTPTLAVHRAVESADAIVNLAGAPLFEGRWTKARRRALVDSRVGLTRALVDAIAGASARPRTLVSASAVGIYGIAPSGEVDERSELGDDFLARLCADWEAAALRATNLGVRVAIPRIGVVLGSGGGALQKLLPPFRAGVGGRVGSGHQPMAWVHLDDVVEAIALAVVDDRVSGPFNAVAPNPVTSAEFARALGAALGRPALLPVPGFALRLAMGPAADVLLGGQRVVPAALRELGFEFSLPTVDAALERIVDDTGCTIRRATDLPNSQYLEARGARYELRQTATLDAHIDDVFGFFSRAENLGCMTPPSMDFAIETPTPVEMRAGATIDYTVKAGVARMRWRTRIDAWDDGRRFVDTQLVGPYRSWWHEHTFTAVGDRTLMEDRVLYSPPLGVLGRIVHRLWISTTLRRLFSFRAQAIGLRFGTASAKPKRKAA